MKSSRSGTAPLEQVATVVDEVVAEAVAVVPTETSTSPESLVVTVEVVVEVVEVAGVEMVEVVAEVDSEEAHKNSTLVMPMRFRA